MSKEGKTVRRVGVEFGGGWGWLMHKNTLHQTKALLRAGCVSSPFMFPYFPLKDKTKRVRAKGDKVQENQR